MYIFALNIKQRHRLQRIWLFFNTGAFLIVHFCSYTSNHTLQFMFMTSVRLNVPCCRLCILSWYDADLVSLLGRNDSPSIA